MPTPRTGCLTGDVVNCLNKSSQLPVCPQVAVRQLECGSYGYFRTLQVSFVFLDRPQQQPWPVVVRRKPRGLHCVKLRSAPRTSVSSSEFGQSHEGRGKFEKSSLRPEH